MQQHRPANSKDNLDITSQKVRLYFYLLKSDNMLSYNCNKITKDNIIRGIL